MSVLQSTVVTKLYIYKEDLIHDLALALFSFLQSTLFDSFVFDSVAVHLVALYSILFYSVLFSLLLFHSIVFHSIPFHSIPFYSILFYSILFYSILFYSILFYSKCKVNQPLNKKDSNFGLKIINCYLLLTVFLAFFLSVLSSDYDLSFQIRSVKSYAAIKKPVPNLSAFTLAFWMRTQDNNPGTVISYATKEGNIVQDNAITLQDYGSFVLFINNQTDFTGLDVNDGQWHHVAVTWESAGGTWHAYKDGVKVISSSAPFQQGEVISGDGVMILGQEQDQLGGGFNTEENFIGDVSQMNIFDHVLSANDIYNLAYSCDHVKGNVAAWGDFRERLFGEYHVTDKSYACDCKLSRKLGIPQLIKPANRMVIDSFRQFINHCAL